jgi:2-dehydro-3-deoxyphosphogluconate aldolase/(4S)-4-hydroxy-2-oxoglutarate aldolase
MNEQQKQLGLLGIVPVIAIDSADDAAPLATALVDGGLPCAEVTFRTAAAAASIRKIADAYPQMLVGAGTVLTIDQARQAIDSGAKFIVSPGFSPAVVEFCLHHNIPVMPGVATATEISTAISLGVDLLKFFPAEASGGVDYLKSVAAPFKGVKFIPTGGVDIGNLLHYLNLPSVIAVGGSWMVKSEMIAQKKFDDIRRLTAEAVAMMLGLRLRHVGINNDDAETARKGAALIAKLMHLPIEDRTTAYYVGTQFEFLARNYLGKHGHISIETNFIERAVAYFERNGIGVKAETRSEVNGKLAVIYLDLEVGGFAFHLTQK